MKRLLSSYSLAAGSWVLSAVGFCACATVESVQESRSALESRIPETWTNRTEVSKTVEAESVSLAKWWTRFEDPVLTALIEDALQRNTDIRSALSAIRQARAQRDLTAAELWPTVNESVGASTSHTHNRTTNSSTSSTSFSAGIDAGWEIDLFGRQGKYVDASDAQLAASIESFHDAQVSLAAEVATTYLSLRANEALLAIVKQNLATRETTQQIIQWQERAGESDALSTQQSIASVEQTRAQIPQLQQSIEEVRNSLAVLTGRMPQELGSLESTADFPDVPNRIAITIPAETLSQRPDIRSAERGIEAAQANLSATERSRLPSLNLKGSIGIEALEAGDIFNPQRIIANALASLIGPIWDAGRISSNIELQTEKLTQAYLEYEARVLAALAEVENALSAIDKYDEQLATLKRAGAAANDATHLADLQYESGEADLLTVLDAQRTELSLEQSRISTQAQALQAHVQLYKALGGGWSTPTDTQLSKRGLHEDN